LFVRRLYHTATMNCQCEHQLMPSKLAGRLSALGAAIMWSSSGFFVKSPVFLDWPSESRGVLLAFWRAAFALVLLLPLVRTPRWRPGLVPLMVSFAAMSGTFLTSMTLTTAANAIWLQMTAPFWVLVFGVLLGERVLRRDLLPLVAALAGVGLIVCYEAGGKDIVGVVMGLLAGLAYGWVVLLLRRMKNENQAWLVAVCHVGAVLLLAPWAVASGVGPSWFQLLVLAGFGMLQMAVPYLLMARALRSISSHEAVAIGLLEPVLQPVWVYLAWGEQPAWWTIIGAGFILCGLAARYLIALFGSNTTA